MNCPGPLPALSFQTAYFQAALCADSAEGAQRHTIHRSYMTAGTGYGLAPFVKVRPLIGFYVINRGVASIFFASNEKILKMFSAAQYIAAAPALICTASEYGQTCYRY